MINPVLEPQTLVCRIGDVLDADMDGETVMMNIEKGSYFGLNKTGTRIWALLEQPIAINELCEQLISDFNVPAEQCNKEVFVFLQNLLARGLLQVVADGRT